MENRFTPHTAYGEVGIHPCDSSDPRELYLDLVKRTVCNLIYEDISLWSYDDHKCFKPLNRFDLKARVNGEDAPTQAHTMTGWHRLSNVQSCFMTVLREDVPGDLVETGVLRGGSTIFMRALLKAYGISDRKVFVCDSFSYTDPADSQVPYPLRRLFYALAALLTRVPVFRWRLALFRFFEKRQASFPRSADPSPDWIEGAMQAIRHLNDFDLLARKDATSVDAVRSHFARYGLLDGQVVFLKGFFSETLPGLASDRVAILRCDGDSFESSYGVLRDVYAKVSHGGFVIIDDYNSFSDCKRAVDRFREENGINDPLIAIDKLAVFWRKG